MTEPKFIVTVGTSAGGMNALSELVVQFSKEMDIAVFSISDFLMLRLQPHTLLQCEIAKENTPVQKGHIYIAPPNHQLMVKKITSYFAEPLGSFYEPFLN